MPAPITDWDDAYANGAHVPGSENYPAEWSTKASEFRAEMLAVGHAQIDLSYGKQERAVYDQFEPAEPPKGIVVFVHGGYWMKLDKSYWSHLAAGAIRRGQRVIIPSYTLCPQHTIQAITQQIAQLITAVGHDNDLPLRLAGHSAGGHLIARMLCADGVLAPALQKRVENAISISGVHDLRPLQLTRMNMTLGLTQSMAEKESPVLLRPAQNTRLTCWVGADERPEFIRQAELLASMWFGLGVESRCHIEPDRHHFDVIEDLTEPDSDLVETLLQAGATR
ncbi:MAG: alpha/beta hydrolase [Gammaproteobacteria bacterium]|nr:alpha/beta hydrolase [Gammaproteobacteria bacterium]